jgi:tripartite-type tricarboxylate transporter receptor subunit TctC
MPGGAGLRLLQYLEFEAPKDGSTVGLFNAALINGAVMDPDQIRVNFRPFGWLGSFSGDTKVCFASARSGIRSIADLSEHRMNVGGTAQGSTAQYGAIMRAILGDRFNLVFGYQSNNDVWLAIDKGEVDGGCTGWASIPAARPSWIADKTINVLVQFARTPQPGIPASPLAGELANSPEVRSAIEFLTAADAFTRPVVLPPGTPPERLRLLQDAFGKMIGDPSFLAHAKSLNVEIDPISGNDLSVRVKSILETPESTVSIARKLIKQ